jgi:hypothetical protein
MDFSELFGGGNVPLWVSGTTYAQNKVLRSPADWQRYVRITNGAGTTDPSADSTNYRPDGARAIKSIQRGVIQIYSPSTNITSATATISAVNPAKCELRFLGASGSNSIGAPDALAYLTLTNATTITATRLNAEVAANCLVAWELTEYY